MSPAHGRRPGAPVAVIALGAMFPGRGTTHGFFRDLIEGVDTIGEVPETHWRIEDYYDPDPTAPDKTYGRRGGFLAAQAFDPVKFGLPPAALGSTDTSQLLALMVADKVMADVEAARGGAIDRSRTSVVLGVASATELTGHMAARQQRPVWERALRASGLDEARVRQVADHMSASYSEWTEATFPGLLGNVVAGRIANRLDLGGSNYVTDAACASSLSALQVAMHELRSGSSDMVFAGGADALNDILMYLCFSKTPALSPTGDCRPFSASADGTILGEGIGMLALKRLDDAERDGDRIHTVIRGLGGASDGRGTAIYAPLASGQARALRRAYEDAGYGPDTVGLVEAHGTGTQAGDRAELEGLRSVFAPDGPPERAWCALGSVKSQIGHTKAAAGAASLVKIVMALSRRVLPPTLKIDRPAPALRSGSPFYVSTAARPWVQAMDTPRRASVSSFGFGGSNFHATLEAYEGDRQPVRHRLWPAELCLFSAGDRRSLARAIAAAREGLADDEALAPLAEASAADFDPDAKLAAYIVAGSKSAFEASADAILERLAQTVGRPLPAGAGLRTGAPARGRTAFLFAGQGSQYVGMGSDLALAFPAALDVWDAAARHPDLGPLRLHEVAFPPPAFSPEQAAAQTRRLTEMVHAQPAIALTALAQLDIVKTLGVTADMAGGHSFGELVALCHGGAMDRAALLSLARARAEAMAAAARGSDGAMLAVRAGAHELAGILAAHPGITLANDNGPQQVALSGSTDDIEAVGKALEGRGTTARRLPVASAFHSPIVAPAVAPFEAAIEAAGLAAPDLPVYSNATARPYGRNLSSVLANQIRQPVRFREMVEAMYADGARTFIEFGPGAVVSSLVSDILGERPATIVALDHKRRNGLDAFLDGLGRLAIAGHRLALDRLYAAQPAPPRPAAPGKFSVSICGANIKPAPKTPNPPAPRPTPPRRARAVTSGADPQSGKKNRAMNETSLSPHLRAAASSTIEHAITEISAAHRHYMDTMAQLVAAAGLPSPGGVELARPAASPATAPVRAALAAPTAQAGRGQPSAGGAASNGSGQVLNTDAGARSSANGAEPAAPEPRPAPAPPARTEPAAAAGAVDEDTLRGALTELIADKTGYPEDMLETDMHLEAELGIDSIKQVEILSAIRERFPDLPDIDPEEMAELTTIAAIARHLAQGPGELAPAERAPAAAPAVADREPAAPQVSAQASAQDASDQAALTALLKSLIADKTGYPADMLEDDMDLEAELGVDSIKQVEILSVLRERRPDLPEVDPEQMAELRSIADLAAHFTQELAQAAA